MEFIRKAIKLGNSAGVILPKKLLGSEVKVIVLSRPLDIKKEVLKRLDNELADILGIYVINKKPIEVLAVTTNIRRVIEDNIKISLVPLNTIKKDMKTNLVLRKKLSLAETILNKSLLSDLKNKSSYNKL